MSRDARVNTQKYRIPSWIWHVHAIFVLCYAQLRPNLWDPMDCSPPGSSAHGGSPGKNTGVGCHSLLQGIFPAQGSNPHPELAGGFFAKHQKTVIVYLKFTFCKVSCIFIWEPSLGTNINYHHLFHESHFCLFTFIETFLPWSPLLGTRSEQKLWFIPLLLTLPTWKSSGYHLAHPLPLPHNFPQYQHIKTNNNNKKKNSIPYLFSMLLSIGDAHTFHWPTSMVKACALRSVQPSPLGGHRCQHQSFQEGWQFHTHLPDCPSSTNSFPDLPSAVYWHSHSLTFNHASFLKCQESVRKKQRKSFLRYESNKSFKGKNV